MAARAHITLKTKLASTLLALGHVSYDHAKLMTEDQILSLYHFHHNIWHAEDGEDTFWNLEPMLIAPHKERTAKVDVPGIAKGKRIRQRLALFNSRMAAKDAGEPKPESKQRSRWPKGRKIANRPLRRKQ